MRLSCLDRNRRRDIPKNY